MPQYNHLFPENTARPSKFTKPRQKIEYTFELPVRDRTAHATRLKNELAGIAERVRDLKDLRKKMHVNGIDGICISFISEPTFEIKFESLDLRTSGIELLAVTWIDNQWYATVFIPEGKLNVFIKKIERYATEDRTDTGKPKNKDLIESISYIRGISLKALWTDNPELFPAEQTEVWWEVWLRKGTNGENLISVFRDNASALGITVDSRVLSFPERSVLLARCTPEQLISAVDLLNVIAELRQPKTTADFFTGIPRREQVEWVNDLKLRTQPAGNDNLSVCILDTGVTQGHPLIEDHLSEEDMHTIEPEWRVHDPRGHGTAMAGISLYVDLTNVFESDNEVQIPFRLESVKIYPPEGAEPNDPKLYGEITKEGVNRPEVTAPDRKRVFASAVTSTSMRDKGRPSSWSSAVDTIASGSDDQPKRLIILSAGNSEPNGRIDYPDNIETELIHDPGQSWNAITVGAYTEKVTTNPEDGWNACAPFGDLSPASTSSLTWEKQWPNKPDVVFEGGNNTVSPDKTEIDIPDSLQLLSTFYRPQERLLTATGDTSAATYLAARFSALLWDRYPNLWPETIWALMVHSARWTDAMLDRFARHTGRCRIDNLVRTCGYGVPDLSKALNSLNSSATMVVQDQLFPFNKEGSTGKTREMHIHHLPWPQKLLYSLGETEVQLRVTLSYFIEPSPGERGNNRKYRYASHGLRFDVKTPTENFTQFQKRINQAARDEDERSSSSSDSGEWEIGPLLRNRGSIHSDWWEGTAAALADRGFIAVFPVGGWWKERLHLGCYNKPARYSLIISLSTPEQSVDIYTPIANMIGVPVTIPITI